jgi:L-asparaginase II
VAHPEYVAGTDRLDTDLMRAAGRRLFAKVGAEGFYCAGIPSLRIGIALKVEDGAKRAAEPALLAVLKNLDAISSGELEQLSKYATPEIRNTRDEVVGSVRVNLQI